MMRELKSVGMVENCLVVERTRFHFYTSCIIFQVSRFFLYFKNVENKKSKNLKQLSIFTRNCLFSSKQIINYTQYKVQQQLIVQEVFMAKVKTRKERKKTVYSIK